MEETEAQGKHPYNRRFTSLSPAKRHEFTQKYPGFTRAVAKAMAECGYQGASAANVLRTWKGDYYQPNEAVVEVIQAAYAETLAQDHFAQMKIAAYAREQWALMRRAYADRVREHKRQLGAIYREHAKRLQAERTVERKRWMAITRANIEEEARLHREEIILHAIRSLRPQVAA